MSESRSGRALPQAIEDAVLAILEGDDDARDAALQGLLAAHPEHDAAIRSWLAAAGVEIAGAPGTVPGGTNRIIKQCVDWLRADSAKGAGPVITDNRKVAPPSREAMKSSMEELIHHFKLFTEVFTRPKARPMPPSSTPRVSSASTW